MKPRLRESKVAYVWVDALRFEMARELARLLEDDFELTVQPALATIPTITEIGMAALLPRAGVSAKVIAVGTGKLGLQIDRTVIKDRKDRIAFLKAHAGVPVFDAKLDDLLPKPSKKVKDGVQGAQLVLITSQEIDELARATTSLRHAGRWTGCFTTCDGDSEFSPTSASRRSSSSPITAISSARRSATT